MRAWSGGRGGGAQGSHAAWVVMQAGAVTFWFLMPCSKVVVGRGCVTVISSNDERHPKKERGMTMGVCDCPVDMTLMDEIV